jgi:hypothetical protein
MKGYITVTLGTVHLWRPAHETTHPHGCSEQVQNSWNFTFIAYIILFDIIFKEANGVRQNMRAVKSDLPPMSLSERHQALSK